MNDELVAAPRVEPFTARPKYIQFFRCDRCGAERASTPVLDDQWFELDVLIGASGWPRMQFRAWYEGKAATHLCSKACLRKWIDDFMEAQLEEKAEGKPRSQHS